MHYMLGLCLLFKYLALCSEKLFQNLNLKIDLQQIIENYMLKKTLLVQTRLFTNISNCEVTRSIIFFYLVPFIRYVILHFLYPKSCPSR